MNFLREWASRIAKIRRVPYLAILVVPYVLGYSGMAMNHIAMVANGNQMPVYVPASLDKICEDPVHAFVDGEDSIHSCMTPKTHLKFLCDWIAIGNPNPDYIMSPGDIGIFLGDWLSGFNLYVWAALLIRKFLEGPQAQQ